MDWCQLALGVLLVAAVGAQEKLKLCVQEDVTESSCNALSRLDSPVKCERVVDSAECAIKLADGRADFGVFTTDELRLAQEFYPSGIQVVAELRNQDKVYEPFEFQSVVVVPKNLQQTSDLSGLGYCHPGFSRSQMWSDHVLKYFEQRKLTNVCRAGLTTIENEIISLRDYFKKACRPGNWVPDDALDRKLKKKYPELCELCPDKEGCKYIAPQNHGHYNALECLTTGRGQVAYVSLEHVKSYFSPNHSSRISDYQFYCEDGTKMDLDSENPCTWFKQPWKVILARESAADSVRDKIKKTARVSMGTVPWEKNLNDILFRDDTPMIFEDYLSPALYLVRAGAHAEQTIVECSQPVRWCTVSAPEQAKCNWTATAARILGIKPYISCVQASSVFECFDWVSRNEADILTIDSNYGLLARKVYGLGALLYCETSEDRYSFVVAVTRDRSQNNRIDQWSDVANKNACFPEFGGIAWLSFINAAREHRMLSDSCDYSRIAAKLLKAACAPGFVEADHAQDHKRQTLTSNDLGKLCELCPSQNNGEQCEANYLNKYYGDKGALDCLKSGDGNIAFLESRNLRGLIAHNYINESEYRVFCKNGTLADKTGFNIDTTCALSVTIDSEVVSRRNSSDPHLTDASQVLLKIEDWLGYRGDSERRAVHVYDPFNGTDDLLFKTSTVGLVTGDTEVRAVVAYKEMFRHADDCSSATAITGIILLSLLNFVVVRLI